MNIPEKVRIGYVDLNVKMHDKEVILDNNVVYGKISFSTGNIDISEIYNEDQHKCTFIHECVHGLDNVYEIGLKENQVKKLGIALYTFIRDNPEIFKENR